ncbi:hypothetical protein [Paraburkholderia phenoliruptrix]|uniref:hypothetical protein n=1 Tax=Paraburkholderia phenoliruptrix TaxID=252970 RepID=UPI001C6EA5BF|nr:hypothetical protein [Paraburkholderia phenoliruptrix]MBW9102912.1 hypothetical protein [Paraburkholderia phenoliruptrix]MBW9132886.1 hypothetical protein [Paraburkholderia ginsengiterrae]
MKRAVACSSVMTDDFGDVVAVVSDINSERLEGLFDRLIVIDRSTYLSLARASTREDE